MQTTLETEKLKVFELTNSHGVVITVTNFGGKIMSLFVPDRSGKMEDIVLGYDTAEEYPTGNPYFGALIGRYGNRIARGKFSLNGSSYQLAINSRRDALHGGPNGFHNRIWDARTFQSDCGQALELHYVSADGEEGYPGELKVRVIYILSESNELAIEYFATTSKTTVVNLSNHAFFNLRGEGNGDVLNHELKINANQYTPVDEGLIPIGELAAVQGTPFDFNSSHAIGDRINSDHPQLRCGKGYDHNWILNKGDQLLSMAALVREPISGRVMEVWTTEPGLQFYSGNFLDGSDIGKAGKSYPFRSAFCLEAQHFPDSPNRPNFPSTVLEPGEIYKQRTVYRFGVD